MSGLTWDDVERFYRRNVGEGNFQPDVAGRGSNRMLAKIAVHEGLGSEDEVQEAFKRWDREAYESSQAANRRIEARDEASR